ncbi:MAG: hypothetical protein JRI97_03340 [Deltaproteobacteria bacterium]|nr:hypothetical protein [Deltaproteobacteria bacterium]
MRRNNRRHLLFFAATAVCLACALSPAAAGRHAPVVQAVGDFGYIRWSSDPPRSLAMVVGRGVGAPPDGGGRALSGPLARAREQALENLLSVCMNVRVTADSTIGDAVAKDPGALAQIKEMVETARMCNREYLSDGTVLVRMGIPLYGGLAQVVLPPTIVQVPQVRQVQAQRPARAEAKAVTPAGEEPEPPKTGLLVDARGLAAAPAMVPRILDEDGREVYGPAWVSREYAVSGMCGYTRDPDRAASHPRVGENPLTVKALSVRGEGRCDLVISNADAARLRGASENLSFLRRCGVVVLLDPATQDPWEDG